MDRREMHGWGKEGWIRTSDGGLDREENGHGIDACDCYRQYII
jgi:hypothetical protein